MTKYGYMMDRDDSGQLIYSDLQKLIITYLSEVKSTGYNNIYDVCFKNFWDKDYVKYIFWADFMRLYHAGIIAIVPHTREYTIIDEGYNLQSILND